MKSQKKVKLLIGVAILIVIALFVITTIQVVNIAKTNKKINNQQKQIQQLEEELDYYKNKLPDYDYDITT